MRPRVESTVAMLVLVGANGSVSMRHAYFTKRLTRGGAGLVVTSLAFARFSAGKVAQEIALRGHANDGADGRPRAPTMGIPF